MLTQIHSSIASREITRLLRNTDNPALFKHHKNKLIKRLARRQYPRRILRELRNITHDMRPRVLFKTKRLRLVDRPLPFITRYTRYTTPNNRIFQRRWRNLYEDPGFYSLLPNSLLQYIKIGEWLGAWCRPKEGNLNFNNSILGYSQEINKNLNLWNLIVTPTIGTNRNVCICVKLSNKNKNKYLKI